MDFSYSFLLPVYDRLSVLVQIGENKVRDGEWSSENDAPWLMYQMADEGLGWGYRVERKEWFNAGLYSTLLSYLPPFFHVSAQGRAACCPRWCCLSRLPSTGCSPFTPPHLQNYTCLIDFREGRPASLSVSHAHIDSLPTASASCAHSGTRGCRCALSVLIQFETRECD